MGHGNRKCKSEKITKKRNDKFMQNQTMPDEMYIANIDWKKQATFDILREQMNQCKEEIAGYNSQYLSSSVLCAILTAVAGIVSTTPENNMAWNLFYVLPTIYILPLYNLIKYTMKQIQLGVYCWTLEYQINEILHEDVLQWTQKIPHGFDHWFLGAAAQLAFYLPIGMLMIWEFCQLNRSFLWIVLGFGIILQIIIIILFIIRLCSTKNRTLKKLGYYVDKDGKLDKFIK